MEVRHADILGHPDLFKDPYIKHSEMRPAFRSCDAHHKIERWYLGGELIYEILDFYVTKRP